jgi:hypothetical protein
MCAAAFYGQRQQSKDSGNTAIDTRHRPIQMAVALLALILILTFFQLHFRYFEASARIVC